MSISLTDLLDNIHILTTTSRLALDIAHEMNVAEGAIINPILCAVGGQSVLILMAGDKACDASQIPRVLNIKGNVKMLNDEEVSS